MKAVLFDLFETLVSHFDAAWRPPKRSKAQRLGLAEEFFRTHWTSFERDWERGTIAHYEEALAGLCRHAGVQPDDAVLAEMRQQYTSYLARTAFALPDPRVVEMLQALRMAGLRLAVVTNANNLDTAPWKTHGLARFFDAFIASHEVGLLKPDRRIYELACRHLQVEPADVVFVGDGGSDELRGAKDAGIEPLWCTWFLDRWPEGIRPGGFPGDDWRQRARVSTAPFRRLERPEQLIATIL